MLFELAETSGNTQLRFTHTDRKAATNSFDSCKKDWEELMLRLKAAAECKGLGPLFSKDGSVS
jgi:predicted lipoprotein with Yx(FWY)xxD motif